LKGIDEMTVEIFKIRRRSDGLFSSGGSNPTFKAKGKIWHARGHVTSHLGILSSRLSKIYADCEVLRFELVETELERTPVLDWKPADSTVRAKELSKQREIEWELNRRREEILRLEKKLADLQNQG
jgi:hypothetical protein